MRTGAADTPSRGGSGCAVTASLAVDAVANSDIWISPLQNPIPDFNRSADLLV
jgi:hypothetical protein